jgi:hypothetical protein
MKKKYFGLSGVYFISILHLYITVTCRHTIVFYAKIASQISKRHLTAHYDPQVFYVMHYIHKRLIHHLSIGD